MNNEIEKKPVFSTRIDLRKIASLARFIADSTERRMLNRSQLVSEIVETFHDVLMDRNIIQPVASYEEALEILRQLGIEFQTGTPAHRAVVKLLEDEDIKLEQLSVASDEELKKVAESFMATFYRTHKIEE